MSLSETVNLSRDHCSKSRADSGRHDPNMRGQLRATEMSISHSGYLSTRLTQTFVSTKTEILTINDSEYSTMHSGDCFETLQVNN